MPETAATIGTFDGLHLGHRRIFRRLLALARRRRLAPMAVTFAAPPRLYFAPVAGPYLLTTVPEKLALFKGLGIRRWRVLEFGPAVARRSARDFFKRELLGRCRTRALVVGYNFHFGKGREGSPEFLKDLGRRQGVAVRVVPPLRRGGAPVSSGRIREVLMKGGVESANRWLGHPYFAQGRVGRGLGLGRKLGFPTANLSVDPLKILPPGVFAVRVTFPGGSGKARGGVCNVGSRPTLKGRGNARSFEVHLLGFQGSLYGRTLQVEFLRRLRPEKKFANLEALRRQIERDRSRAAQYLRKAGAIR